MTSVFDETVTAKLNGVEFGFYEFGYRQAAQEGGIDLEEVYDLSVKEVNNPVAYDELNNPTQHGIVDEAMGVSAMNKNSKCKT